MIQYCRYCCFLFTGNGIWCEKQDREISEAAAKSPNRCHNFAYTPIDAFRDGAKEYRARKPKKTGRDRQCDGQISLKEMEERKNMEEQKKLTWTDKCGGWGLKGYDMSQAPEEIREAIYRLKEYEMSGLAPDQLKEVDTEFSKQARELMYYRELKSKGRLFEFPCEVGDVLYMIDTDPKICCKSIGSYIVSSIKVFEADSVLFLDYAGNPICDLESLQNGTPFLDYYMIYLTYDEAQKALDKLN